MGGKSNQIFIEVQRDHLLVDSMRSILSLSPLEMKHLFRIHFVWEEGIDEGGLKREWFELISNEIFDMNNMLVDDL